ncbi:hypothetical protein CYMTET_29637 [Cymbomonas tetramitiformis]|uniref:Uncharacterized protein n=1 Tax=Cymbomonas tetramitiformis TaxID=36881 RepID=A0AAE0KUP9_9CHLO|nr:hypothetical protein CYMTET_29637 [Cymbomonas tetramitiformis]
MQREVSVREVRWRQDRDDWQLSPVLFAEMDEEFGPFTLDACVTWSRANAFCSRSWSTEDDARVQKFDGHNAWANLPFSVMYDILRNFLRCKRRQQMEALLEELEAAVGGYQDMRYAEHTKRAYDTGVRAFLTFCVRFACLGCLDPLLPASDATLARFIAFSAWFVQPSTIKSYLAGVRSLHLQQSKEWVPVADRF